MVGYRARILGVFLPNPEQKEKAKQCHTNKKQVQKASPRAGHLSLRDQNTVAHRRGTELHQNRKAEKER